MKGFKKASDALIAAKELIKPIKRWTQGELAVKFVDEGYYEGPVARRCSTSAKEAEAFCALGAVRRVDGPAERSATAFLREAAFTMIPKDQREREDYHRNSDSCIFEVNDGETDKVKAHRRVLRMFNKAIKAAKAAGN